MPIRFKFRSSIAFDRVELGAATSISVRNLRSRIAEHKNLNCGGFDLIISDARTGEEYENEESMIPDGSDVIIKRVPAATGAAGASANCGTVFVSSPSPNIDMNTFDDFGNDFYPVLDASLPNSDAEVSDTNCCLLDKNSRPSFREHASAFENKDGSDLSEAESKDNSAKKCHQLYLYSENGKNLKPTCQAMEPKKFYGKHDLPSSQFLYPDFPIELKCSLCNSVFKDAVMIPCCQHSFCEKCIRSALAEKLSCPMCASRKYSVGDLLPNVSLRQAIERFPDIHIGNSGSDKIVRECIPDGESGIRGKDVSCASSFHLQEAPRPESPSATGKGSNQILTETALEYQTKNKGLHTGSQLIHLYAAKPERPGHHGREQESNNKTISENPNFVPSELPQNSKKPEGNLAIRKKKGLLGNSSEYGVLSSRQRKGDRTCYMCGSPDHLIRDCPVASGQHANFQTGDMFLGGFPPYRHAYWQGNPYTPMRPYMNLYGTSSLIPLNTGIVPVTPLPVPSYMPSFYSGLAVPCGFMGMGGTNISMPPIPRAAECPPHTEIELHESKKQRMLRNGRLKSKRIVDDDQDVNLWDNGPCSGTPQSSFDHEVEIGNGNSRSYSGHRSPKLPKKHSLMKSFHDSSRYQMDHDVDDEIPFCGDNNLKKGSQAYTSKKNPISSLSEESSSDMQYLTDTSYPSGKKRKKYCKKSGGSRNHDEREDNDSSDEEESRHRYNEGYVDKEKISRDYKRVKRSNQRDSSRDPDSSSRRKHHKKRSSHYSRSTKVHVSTGHFDLSKDELVTDGGRWEMTDGGRWEMADSLHDSHEDYRYLKYRSR